MAKTIRHPAHIWIRSGLLALALLLSSETALARGWLLVPADVDMDTVSRLDLKKVYMGRKTQIGSLRIKPLNAPVNSQDRTIFLRDILGMSELDYTGYWHVRRYSGQGTPPPEIDSLQELLQNIASTGNTIGYVMSESKPEISGPVAGRVKILPIESGD